MLPQCSARLAGRSFPLTSQETSHDIPFYAASYKAQISDEEGSVKSFLSPLATLITPRLLFSRPGLLNRCPKQSEVISSPPYLCTIAMLCTCQLWEFLLPSS
jgi:hypothetical protein